MTAELAVRRLGPLAVAPVGFGTLVLSPGYYGPVTEREAQSALEAALAASGGAGRLLVDTSDSYGADYHGERLVGRWSASHRDDVVVSTKFGFRPPAGTRRHAFEVGYAFGELAVNGSPELVRGYALGSLRRLGAERLDLLSPHFPDPVVPIGETVGAIAELAQEGLVANVGVANVSAAQLAEAAAVCTIAAVQVEWSIWHRPDPDLLAVADQHGIGIVAWGPLGSGFLAGGLRGPGSWRLSPQLPAAVGTEPGGEHRSLRPHPRAGTGLGSAIGSAGPGVAVAPARIGRADSRVTIASPCRGERGSGCGDARRGSVGAAGGGA